MYTWSGFAMNRIHTQTSSASPPRSAAVIRVISMLFTRVIFKISIHKHDESDG